MNNACNDGGVTPLAFIRLFPSWNSNKVDFKDTLLIGLLFEYILF